jgi:hypothetical protein
MWWARLHSNPWKRTIGRKERMIEKERLPIKAPLTEGNQKKIAMEDRSKILQAQKIIKGLPTPEIDLQKRVLKVS